MTFNLDLFPICFGAVFGIILCEWPIITEENENKTVLQFLHQKIVLPGCRGTVEVQTFCYAEHVRTSCP